MEPLQDLETFAAAVVAAEGIEVTELLVAPAVWTGLRLLRPPLPGKRPSIRAARRDRGRIIGAMRAAEARARRRALSPFP